MCFVVYVCVYVLFHLFVCLFINLLALYEKAEIAPEEKKPNHLIVAVSSDRGLCGGIHSNIAKNIKATIAAHQPSGDRITVVCVGDKVRTILQRTHSSNILMGFSELGKKPPTFKEASHVAQEVLNSGVEFESAEIVYNRFKCVNVMINFCMLAFFRCYVLFSGTLNGIWS